MVRFVFFLLFIICILHSVNGYGERKQKESLNYQDQHYDPLLLQTDSSCPTNKNGICSSNGECIKGICVCNSTYIGLDCSFTKEQVSTCPHLCYGNGICNINTKRCECYEGYKGIHCSEYIGCSKKQYCSGKGKCDEQTDTCLCESGWKGDNCNIQETCPDNCSGKGICQNNIHGVSRNHTTTSTTTSSSSLYCSCDSMYENNNCGTINKVNSCPFSCSGNGKCNQISKQCECFEGYKGPACNIVSNLCSFSCGKGLCKKESQFFDAICNCSKEYKGDNCDEVVLELTPCSKLNQCSGRGLCNPISSSCDCFKGFKGDSCEFVDEVTTCKSFCSGHGKCITSLNNNNNSPYCECDDTWKGEGCEISKCNVDYSDRPCSSQGICMRHYNNSTKITEYKCECDEGFEGSFCEIQIVPCAQNCSITNGKCVDGECVCKTGWSGPTCSIDLNGIKNDVVCCPLNCSDNGNCDMINCKCSCSQEWTGDACNVFASGDDNAI